MFKIRRTIVYMFPKIYWIDVKRSVSTPVNIRTWKYLAIPTHLCQPSILLPLYSCFPICVALLLCPVLSCFAHPLSFIILMRYRFCPRLKLSFDIYIGQGFPIRKARRFIIETPYDSNKTELIFSILRMMNFEHRLLIGKPRNI